MWDVISSVAPISHLQGALFVQIDTRLMFLASLAQCCDPSIRSAVLIRPGPETRAFAEVVVRGVPARTGPSHASFASLAQCCDPSIRSTVLIRPGPETRVRGSSSAWRPRPHRTIPCIPRRSRPVPRLHPFPVESGLGGEDRRNTPYPPGHGRRPGSDGRLHFSTGGSRSKIRRGEEHREEFYPPGRVRPRFRRLQTQAHPFHPSR